LITNQGSVRREVVIDAGAEELWAIVGDPGRVQEWFPGIESSHLEGTARTITLSSGQVVTETIVTRDPLQRRLQYSSDGPMCRRHLATLDVVPIDEGRCLVVFGTDAEPAASALALGGAAGAALENLARRFEEAR
jgi:uncharacterized protein YndB with AHSA1/START domain